MGTTEMPLDTAMKRGARIIGRGFTKHDDDWVPVLIFRSRDGEIHQAIVPLAKDDVDRDQAAGWVRATLHCAHAVEACIVMSAWCVVASDYDFESDPRPSEHPDRKEILTLTHVTKDKASVEAAMIVREDGKPPKLGPWGPVSEGLDAMGRFIDAMRLGVG